MDFTDSQFALREDGVFAVSFKNKKNVSERDKMGVVLKDDERAFKEVFKEFGDNTTFHGLRYITNNSHHAVRRLFWLVAVTAMIAWLAFDIMKSVTLLLKYDEITTISMNYLTDVKFPAVTLCNYNQLRNGSLSKAAIETLGLVYASPSSPLPIDATIDTSPLQDVFRNRNDSENIQILKDASHQIEDMILICKWRNKPCSHLNFTQRVLDHGVCYTFNDPVDEEDVLTVHSPGSRNGLYLRLNIEQELYTAWENTAAGMKVLLHPQGELPIIKELAFSLSPGFESVVAVQQKVVNSLQAPFRDNCTNNNFTDYPFKYSVPACNFLCKIHYIIDKCGCRDYRWPGNEPICNVHKQVYCVYRYEAEYLELGIPCDCPIACKTTQYNSKISTAYWPNINLLAARNLSAERIRLNFLDVYIFCEEIMTTVIDQHEAYTWTDFQGNVGGYMGLLCGMSLITLLEWADFVLMSLLERFWFAKKAK